MTSESETTRKRRFTPEQLAKAAYEEVPPAERLSANYADLTDDAKSIWLRIGRSKFNNGWMPRYGR